MSAVLVKITGKPREWRPRGGNPTDSRHSHRSPQRSPIRILHETAACSTQKQSAERMAIYAGPSKNASKTDSNSTVSARTRCI